MIRLRALARSLAATAIASVALIAFSGVANAATLSVSVPNLLDGAGSGQPVVSVGTGPATNPPVPGTDASAPTHVEVGVHPDASSLPVPDPTGQSGRLAPMGSGHVQVDACIAATILSGDDPQSCPGAIDGSNPVVGQLSALEDAGTLPRVLADVGGCVEAQQAAAAPIDLCTSSIPVPSVPGGSLPTGSLPTGALPSGSLPTGGVGDLSSLGSGSLPSGGFDPATVTKALAASGLCDLANQVDVGVSGSCSNRAAAPGIPVGTGGNALGSERVCLGFAAVMHVDSAGCTASAAANAAAHGGATVGARNNGGATVAAGAGPAAQMRGSCVTNVGATSSSTPVAPVAAGGLAGAGLGLAALGKALRRLRPRAVVAA